MTAIATTAMTSGGARRSTSPRRGPAKGRPTRNAGKILAVLHDSIYLFSKHYIDEVMLSERRSLNPVALGRNTTFRPSCITRNLEVDQPILLLPIQLIK